MKYASCRRIWNDLFESEGRTLIPSNLPSNLPSLCVSNGEHRKETNARPFCSRRLSSASASLFGQELGGSCEDVFFDDVF